MSAPNRSTPADGLARIRASHPSRRQFLQMMAAVGMIASAPGLLAALPDDLVTRPLPGSDERVAAVGMGTYRTFDVSPSDDEAMLRLAEVMRAFYQGGGRVVDSSPMYGRAEAVLGQVADTLGITDELFFATKVWTSGAESGRQQMETSFRHFGVNRMELMQVHNLLDFETHLDTLRRWKEEGLFRYIGVTHYRESRHDELARLVERYPLDFVQCNFNVLERNARERLFPACRDKGVGVLINEPFGQGRLFRLSRGRPLPGWASDIGARTWAQVFLKYIISYPAVTAAIPATSKPSHSAENIAAARGALPDEALRKAIEAAVG